jgi:Toxin PAAR-like domain
MADEVYANSQEISCKAGSGKSIAAMPDVCFTPPQTPATPPGVPIPYPNTGMASDCTEGSKTVQISGQEVMLKDKSYFKKSTGDEAGSAPKKGVITSKITGKVYFVAWSMDVKFEGENVVRHLDMTTHNHGSPQPNTGPTPHQSKASSAQTEKDPCRHRRKKNKRYVIYKALDNEPGNEGKIYVGRTSGPASATAEAIKNKRQATHHRKQLGPLTVIHELDSYSACRGAEQLHREHFKNKKKPPIGTKQINPIHPDNPRRKDYIECAKRSAATTKCAICGAGGS